MNLRKKRFRTSALVLLFCLTAFGFASDIKIFLPDDSARELTVVESIPEKAPVGGREFASKQIKINATEKELNGFAILVDKKRGWVAVRKISDFKAGEWNVADAEWMQLSVIVEANQGGLPLRDGIATLVSGGKEKRSRIVEGKAELFFIPFGSATVVVEYTVSGQSGKTTPQQFLLSKDKPNPVVAITVPGVAAFTPEQNKDAVKKNFSLANGLIWLIALVAGIAILFFILKMLRNNEDLVTDRLRKMGVAVPEPLSDDSQNDDSIPSIISQEASPSLVPEGHCEFCGQPLAPGGVCACAMPAKPAGTQTAKMLIGSGVSFPLTEGTHIIGREAEWIVSEPTISRKHAQIEVVGTSILISDLGSSNGTFVNGKQLTNEVSLSVGDTIQLGKFVLRVDS